VQFAVGFKIQGKTGHVVVDAEDALLAALKVKMQRPEALIAPTASKTDEATPVTLCADSAARTLSADSQTTWRNVTWPLRRPGDRLSV
jgi:hypothetical protein